MAWGPDAGQFLREHPHRTHPGRRSLVARLGASYRPTPKLTIDAGFAHLFFEDADTRNVVTLDTGNLAIVTPIR